MEAAKADQIALRDAYVDFDKAAAAAVRHIEAVRTLRGKVQAANAQARAAGRHDLELADPFTLLRQVAAHAHNDPAMNGAVVLADYFPLRHPDGPPLAAMGKVKL